MANLLSATTIGDSQVLSVGNMTSHGVITTSNIGSQSVSYAGSAGYTPTISLTSLGSGSVNVNNGSSAVYRTETGNGAAVAYAPLLHLGGGDTMWQIQGTYGTSGDGTLYFRQGYSGSWGNWLTMLSNSNYNSYSPTLTGGGASGTWGISISGNSAYASSAGSVNGNMQGTFAGDISWNGGVNINVSGESSFDLFTNGQWGVWESQTASWWIRANWGDHLRLVENGKNVYVYGSRLYNDSGQQAVFNNGGTWNISISGNSAYASSAGNADTVDGYHANNAAGGIAVINANGYWYPPSWINVGGAGIYSGTNNAHLLPNGTSPHGAWEMIGSRGGWSGIYFRDSGNTIMANANDSGFYNANAGWQIEWYNGTLYCSKSANGGGTQATVLDSSNYTSWAPSLTGGGASGTWGISISGNASTASTASNSNALGGIGVGGFLRDDGWNSYPGQDANTQEAMRVDFTYSNNAPYTGELIRFGSSGYSTQFNTSYGSSDNFSFRTRNGDTGTWNDWRTIIHSGNIGSQSVSYASSSGNSDTVDGYHLNQSVSVNASPTFQEVYANGWFRTTGYQGLYNPTNGAHFYPNDYSYGAWRIIGTRNGWNGLHFGGGNGITLMMNEGEFGFHREAVGWVARFTSGYFHGTSSAADSVAWGNVSGRPTALSQFTNDSGYITSSGRAYPRRSDGADLNFYWSGQDGQPTWLWGGNDGANMYVYNPSNFSVSYANSAGYVPGGVKYNEWYGNVYIGSGGDFYSTVFYDTNDSYWRLDPSDYSRYNTADINRIHNYGWYTNSQWGDSAMLCIGGDFDPSYPIQIETERWGASLYTNKGALWALDFIGSSDIRYKTNIANISNGLSVVNSLQPVTYNRIDDSAQKTKAGLIAQEVESVLPHVVSSTIEPETLNEVLGIDYVQLVPYLISAIKQQQQQIEDLTNRISQLEQ